VYRSGGAFERRCSVQEHRWTLNDGDTRHFSLRYACWPLRRLSVVQHAWEVHDHGRLVADHRRRTVQKHLQRIYQKPEVETRTAAVMRALALRRSS
jgi:hypothetical protein